MWNTGNYFLLMCCFVKRTIPLALITFLLGACPLISFKQLEISCSLNEGEQYYAQETVDLKFSLRPNREETEQRLILIEGGLSTSPVFSWEGRTLCLKPAAGWKKGEHYSVSLEGQLSMEDGRTYTTGITRAFIYGEKGNDFTLLSSTQSSAPEAPGLVFTFSQAPKITSFTRQFSLSPSTEYITDFSGSTVRLLPKKSWQINTRYTWTIKDMESDDGYLMKKEYSGFFAGPEDPQVPFVKEICPVILSEDSVNHLWRSGLGLDSNLENGEGIGFVFSKPMDHGSLRSGISFYPSIKGYFMPAGEDAVIFIPEEEYKPETEYRITLSESVKDSLGLSLFQENRFYFTPNRRYLRVEKVSLDSETQALEPGGILQDHVLESPSFGLGVKIVFSQAIPPDKRKSAADGVSLSVLFPASAHNPVQVSTQWLDNGAILSLYYEDLSPSNGGVDNYYQIKITSGSRGPVNGTGDYLKEDLWYVVRIY
jgi:hypothetical protein